MLIGICFLLGSHFTGPAEAQQRPLNCTLTGLGALSLNQADVFSFTVNPASLSRLKYPEAGVFGERRFMLAELNYFLAASGFPTKAGNFGLQAVHFGFTDFNETRLGLAYARKLGSLLDLGVQFSYHGKRMAGYGNASAISADLGAVLHLTEKLHAGIALSNPAGGKFNKDGPDKLPARYTMGFGFEASDKFFAGAEIIKEEDQPVNVQAGFLYQLISRLQVRAGVSSATSSMSFAIGFSWKALQLNIGTSLHPQLGITPGLMLHFRFKQAAANSG